MDKDPYRYFRIEARELLEGLTQGVLQLERGPAGKDVVGRLLRLAHTLKGAARVVQQPEIAELSHAVEDILEPYREGQSPMAHDHINALLRLVDSISVHLRSLETPSPEPAATPPQAAVEEPIETVRVEIAEMDALLSGMSEAAIHLGALRQATTDIAHALQTAGTLAERLASRANGTPTSAVASHPADRTRALTEELRAQLEHTYRTLAARLDRAEQELGKVREQASELRLLPASAVFASLQRAARDVAESLQKRLEFVASGGETRLDAHVLRAVRDALLQLVRNAVAHGIEAESERIAMGKPPVGRVELHVERRGNRVVFVCRDDGRGLDVEAIRRAAVVRGLVSATEVEALSVDEAIQLLLRGGVSTTPTVTEISGRGVGLDIVRETVARFKGDMHVRSEATRGTAIEISVLVSIESLVVLVMEAAGTSVLLPFDAVRRTIRLTPGDIARAATGDSLLFEGEVMPFLPLAKMWRQPMLPGREAQSWSAVVVQAGSRLAAVGVDRLLGSARVMLRPLPAILGNVPLIAGASFDSEGNPQPVLDPAGLVEAVWTAKASTTEAVVAPKPEVLVIDDSLTTRMLEQSILESAGYAVDLATCGEEALEKARQGRYALFIVDIEMPGMDGFTLIEHLRADPALYHIPAILVSSRAAVEDRRRGEQVGARGYIVKSEFDEGDFLRTIRSLIG